MYVCVCGLFEILVDVERIIGPDLGDEEFIVRWWEEFNAMVNFRAPIYEDYCSTHFVRFSEHKYKAWVYLRTRVVATYSTEKPIDHRCSAGVGKCNQIDLFVPNANSYHRTDGRHENVTFHLL